MWRLRLQALAVFGIAMSVYALTCARHVTLVDSGELIVAAATLGVAHPPGFPVYTLVGRLFSELPVGSVAFRLSLMSAFFAALTAAMTTVAAGEIATFLRRDQTSGRAVRRRGKRKGLPDAESVTTPSGLGSTAPGIGVADLAPASGGLALAFSLTLWLYATVAEVYTLTLFLLVSSFAALLAWRRRRAAVEPGDLPRVDRLIVVPGLICGLALGVHHVSVLLALPALCLFVGRTAGARFLYRPPFLLAAAAAALLAVLCYGYLPWAARGTAPLIWGDPLDATRLWWHVTGKWYQVNLFSGTHVIAQNFEYLGALLWRQLTPLGLAVVPFGVRALWRRDRTTLLSLVLIALLGTVYALNYEIAEDTDAYYLTTTMVLSILAAAGLVGLQLGAATPRARAIGVLLCVVVPLANLASHYRDNDRHDYMVARTYVEDAVSGVASGGLLLTLDWQLYAPFLYLHHIEGYRPDVTVVDVNLVRRSWYVETYLVRTYPEMMAACAEEAEAFLSRLGDWERGRPNDPAELTRTFTALLDAFIDYHRPAREAHVTLPMERGVGADWEWVPHGLTMRLEVRGSSRAGTLDPPALRTAPLEREPLDEVARGKVRPYYARMIANGGMALARSGRADEGRAEVARAVALDPELAPTYIVQGDVEAGLGDRVAARAAYLRALELDPGSVLAESRLRALSGP